MTSLKLYWLYVYRYFFVNNSFFFFQLIYKTADLEMFEMWSTFLLVPFFLYFHISGFKLSYSIKIQRRYYPIIFLIVRSQSSTFWHQRRLLNRLLIPKFIRTPCIISGFPCRHCFQTIPNRRHQTLQVAWSEPVQHVLYRPVWTTQCKVDPARLMG